MSTPDQLLIFAAELRTQCDAHNIALRIGLHAEDGQLYEDINGMVNVAGNGINIAQRVMSQADGGQILTSGTYYGIVSSKLGESTASRHLNSLGSVQVKHGVTLDLYVYADPKYPSRAAGEPSKQHERRLVSRGIQSNLARIESKWVDVVKTLKPEDKGAEGLPEFRVTILYCAPHPLDAMKPGLRVSSCRYMRDLPWPTEPPPRVYFTCEQGPGRALSIRRQGDKLIQTALLPITELPDTKGSHVDGDPAFEEYCTALNDKCGTPKDIVKLLRRHARSYFYLPFGLGDEGDPWDGVISIDSILPFTSRNDIWHDAVTSITPEWEAIGCLWKLNKRI